MVSFVVLVVGRFWGGQPEDVVPGSKLPKSIGSPKWATSTFG